MTQYKALIVPHNWREELSILSEKEPRQGGCTAKEMYSSRISLSSANIIILTMLDCPRMMRLLLDYEAWYREWYLRPDIDISRASEAEDYPFNTISECKDFIEWIRLKLALAAKIRFNLEKLISHISNLYLENGSSHTFETLRSEISKLNFVGEDKNDG